jgi:hypothetical protein
MRRPCARIVPQRRPKLGRRIAVQREPELANGNPSTGAPRWRTRPSSPGRRRQRTGNGVASSRRPAFQTGDVRGRPAPPAVHVLRPRSAHIARPAVRDGGLRAGWGGGAGAGGDAAELRARLARRPGLRARRASRAAAQDRPADPGDGTTVRAHLSRAVHYQPICNEAASAQLVYCQSICNEPCLWACNATPRSMHGFARRSRSTAPTCDGTRVRSESYDRSPRATSRARRAPRNRA